MQRSNIIGDNIAYYRRLLGLTQEQLSEKLNVSTGAVSKWEQKISCPDIMILPRIAEVLQISIDELFGKELVREPIFDYVSDCPWEDDGKMRIALYHGKKLITHTEFTFDLGKNCVDFSFYYEPKYNIKGTCKFFVEK